MALASVGVWRHTIVLTGALTHRTVHELEVEIEQGILPPPAGTHAASTSGTRGPDDP